MKKSLLSLSLVAIVLTFSNCGSSETAGNTNAQQVASSKPAETKGEKSQPSSTGSTVLDPNKIDLSKPISVADLRNSIFQWDGKEVAVLAYGQHDFQKGNIMIAFRLTLVGEPGSKNKLIECEMKEGSSGSISDTTPVVIKGTISGPNIYARDENIISMKNCELVSKDAAGEKGKADPSSIDLSKPIPASDLHNAFFAWEGKQVFVVGNYNGSTTSTVNSGKVIRVDLSDSAGNQIACIMKTDPGSAARRDGVIRGTVKGRYFGTNIQLVDCELAN